MNVTKFDKLAFETIGYEKDCVCRGRARLIFHNKNHELNCDPGVVSDLFKTVTGITIWFDGAAMTEAHRLIRYFTALKDREFRDLLYTLKLESPQFFMNRKGIEVQKFTDQQLVEAIMWTIELTNRYNEFRQMLKGGYISSSPVLDIFRKKLVGSDPVKSCSYTERLEVVYNKGGELFSRNLTNKEMKKRKKSKKQRDLERSKDQRRTNIRPSDLIKRMKDRTTLHDILFYLQHDEDVRITPDRNTNRFRQSVRLFKHWKEDPQAFFDSHPKLKPEVVAQRELKHLVQQGLFDSKVEHKISCGMGMGSWFKRFWNRQKRRRSGIPHIDEDFDEDVGFMDHLCDMLNETTGAIFRRIVQLMLFIFAFWKTKSTPARLAIIGLYASTLLERRFYKEVSALLSMLKVLFQSDKEAELEFDPIEFSSLHDNLTEISKIHEPIDPVGEESPGISADVPLQQQGESPNLFVAFKNVFLSFFGVKVSDGALKASDEATRRYFYAERSLGLNQNVFSKIFAALYTALQDVIIAVKKFFKIPTDDPLREKANEWSEEVNGFLSKNAAGNLFSDERDAPRVLVLYHTGRVIRKHFMEYDAEGIMWAPYNSTLMELLKLQVKATDHLSCATTREIPLFIVMYGKPGVGKSTLYKMQLAKIKEVLGEKVKPGDGDVFFQNPAEEFDDGYKGQFMYVIDDAFQKADAETTSTLLLRIIQFVNSVPHPMHTADLNVKNMVWFTSQLVVLSTNMKDINKPGIADLQAYKRRRAIYVQVELNPDRVVGKKFSPDFWRISLMNTFTENPIYTFKDAHEYLEYVAAVYKNKKILLKDTSGYIDEMLSKMSVGELMDTDHPTEFAELKDIPEHFVKLFSGANEGLGKQGFMDVLPMLSLLAGFLGLLLYFWKKSNDDFVDHSKKVQDTIKNAKLKKMAKQELTDMKDQEEFFEAQKQHWEKVEDIIREKELIAAALHKQYKNGAPSKSEVKFALSGLKQQGAIQGIIPIVGNCAGFHSGVASGYGFDSSFAFRGLFIDKNTVLATEHQVAFAEQMPQVHIYRTKSKGLSQAWIIKWDQINRKSLGNDLCLLSLPGEYPFKDIIKFIPTKKWIEEHFVSIADNVTRLDINLVADQCVPRPIQHAQVLAKHITIGEGEDATVYADAICGFLPGTKVGDCGSPVVNYSEQAGPNVLLGIHVAGSHIMAMASPVYKEMFRSI